MNNNEIRISQGSFYDADKTAEDNNNQIIKVSDTNISLKLDIPLELKNSVTQKKILVIEDDLDIRSLISCTLKSENYEVLEAENGTEGFIMAKHLQPDLILSDIMMPEMDGFELLTKLKEESTTKNIPFIFLTSTNSPASIRLSKELGANTLLSKPFNDKVLITINEHLSI